MTSRRPPRRSPYYWETALYQETGQITHLLLTDRGFENELRNRLRESRAAVLELLATLDPEAVR